MCRLERKSVVVLLVAFFGIGLTPTYSGEGGQSSLLPPNAKFRGQTFDAWNVLATEWTIATGLGGQDLPNTIDGMRFLSGAFSPGVYEFDVEIEAGTGIVFPSSFVFGELYEDGTEDDPVALADLIEFLNETTTIETSFDGKVVLEGTANELEAFQYGVEYFDEPVYYTEPQPRDGAPDAVAALWTFGTGSVYTPTSVGEHTLVSVVNSDVFGEFTYIYHITVVPAGK